VKEPASAAAWKILSLSQSMDSVPAVAACCTSKNRRQKARGGRGVNSEPAKEIYSAACCMA
jgi:hypothetical protein